MSTTQADLMHLIRERRYDEAAQRLTQLCAGGASSRGPWAMLAICLAALERRREVFALVELRQQRAGDGLELFYDCISSARGLIERAPLLRLIAETPGNSLLFIVAQFFAGVLAASDGDVEGGIDQIRLAGAAACAFLDKFRDDPYLRLIPMEAAKLEDAAGVAAIEAADRGGLFAAYGKLQERIELPSAGGTAPQAGFVFLSSCDERYLDRFGASVTKALDETGVRTVYHLHVVDPSPEIGTKIDRLQAQCSSLDLRYSVEHCRDDSPPGPRHASYYACARLVRLPEILAHYGRDVFMWDMDTSGIRNFDALPAAMPGFDLGYFEMKNTIPSLVCHLAAAYFTNSAATRQLADLLVKYVLAKLPKAPFWILDQAALFCTTRYMLGSRADFRINDFSTHPGGDFYDVVEVAGSSEEKRRMRDAAGA